MATRDLFRSHRVEEAVAAGQAALEESRFEEASNYFRSALKRGGWSSEEEAGIRCCLSEALEKRGLNREQLEVVTKYEKLAEFGRLPEHSQMIALIRLGWGYSFNNDLPRAIALFNQAIQIARRLEDQAGMGACYFGLGRAYRNFSEIRIARDHYTSALEHFRHIGDWRKLAESYLYIGYIQAYEGDFRSALQSLKQSQAIIGEKDEHDLLGRANMYLAVTYDNLGITNKALLSYEKCIAHFRQAGNITHLAINQNNIADKLVWLGRWEEAEKLVKEAIEVLSESTLIAQYGGALDTLANLYMLQGRFDEANSLIERSLEIINAHKSAEWVEISTRLTMGRILMAKGEPERAREAFQRGADVCLRGGNLRYAAEVRLLLADSILALGDIKQARGLIENVRSYLRDSPSMLAWGLMMRMFAKLEAAESHTAAAIQSLSQSSSIYSLRGNIYDCAVNRVLLARLYESQEKTQAAVSELEPAVETFAKLGAAIDEKNARQYLDDLKAEMDAFENVKPGKEMAALSYPVAGLRFETPESGRRASLELASALDGFIAQRLVQASVSRDLLLYELVSILKEESASRGAIIVEIVGDEFTRKEGMKLRVASAIGLDENEQAEEIEILTRLAPDQYDVSYVYRLSDNQQTNFLLHIIWPTAERFLKNTINIQPLLSIVEQGLEAILLRSKSRRTQVFDPARLLSQVELPGFICASRAMSSVLEQIHKIRSSDVTVLITGESGTGKELIARAVHAGSSRRFNTFLPFNCSAAPKEMIESQLFGYKKGAFTGAISANEGVVRAAERGTLFLDEIGDLPIDLQPKLLRFLQEGEIHPFGENQPLKVDVRVVAATNSNLERAVEEGKFREDLFHRLNVIRIMVPALRQRREEIPALINYYLTMYQKEAAKSEMKLSEEALDLMVVYDWPGNVRQLCNEVRRIVAYAESNTVVSPDGLSPEIIRASREIEPVPVITKKPVQTLNAQTPEGTLSEAVEELERRMIQEALRRSSGNIARAAKELGLSRKGLYLKMDRFNFSV
jgi:hydrogenase-4 transcriptional activator